MLGDANPTDDGTYGRDHTRVVEFAAGDLPVLNRVVGIAGAYRWNFQTARGKRSPDVAAAFERARGNVVPFGIVGRRFGDAAIAYADPSLTHQELDWTADRSLDAMCTDAWRWQQSNPRGYPDE